jgi:hypothetical protein
MKIKITHQSEKTVHHFTVKNNKFLTQKEVNKICEKMGVHALLVEGKIYNKQ